MWTKRTIVVIAVSGLAAAGMAGVAVAAGTDDARGADDLLDTWVDEGTISQDDADAFDRVREQLQGEREERRAERQEQRQAHQQEVADAAGVTADQLRERLRGGETLAEIAGENAEAVRSVLLTHAEERLAERAERLDDATASVEERVDAIMNGEAGQGFGPGGRGGPGAGPGAGPGEGPGAGPGGGPGGAGGPGSGAGLGAPDDATDA